MQIGYCCRCFGHGCNGRVYRAIAVDGGQADGLYKEFDADGGATFTVAGSPTVWSRVGRPLSYFPEWSELTETPVGHWFESQLPDAISVHFYFFAYDHITFYDTTKIFAANEIRINSITPTINGAPAGPSVLLPPIITIDENTGITNDTAPRYGLPGFTPAGKWEAHVDLTLTSPINPGDQVGYTASIYLESNGDETMNPGYPGRWVVSNTPRILPDYDWTDLAAEYFWGFGLDYPVRGIGIGKNRTMTFTGGTFGPALGASCDMRSPPDGWSLLHHNNCGARIRSGTTNTFFAGTGASMEATNEIVVDWSGEKPLLTIVSPNPGTRWDSTNSTVASYAVAVFYEPNAVWDGASDITFVPFGISRPLSIGPATQARALDLDAATVAAWADVPTEIVFKTV